MRQRGNAIPQGRKLTDNTCKEFADQLIGCLQMWGITKADSYRIIMMMREITTAKSGPWDSPLKGTGLKADTAIEGGLRITDNDTGKTADFEFPKAN